MTQNDGGPAFPGLGYTDNAVGMSLRDYFAGQALAAIIAATSKGQHQPGNGKMSTIPGMAFDAYEMARAMISARDAK